MAFVAMSCASWCRHQHNAEEAGFGEARRVQLHGAAAPPRLARHLRRHAGRHRRALRDQVTNLLRALALSHTPEHSTRDSASWCS